MRNIVISFKQISILLMYMSTLYLFRRDLRLVDNMALFYATKTEKIIPCFIFTPEQVTTKNKYRSEHAIQFMVESLDALDQDLRKHNSRMHYFQGDNIDILTKIIRLIDVKQVVFAKDYTPYAEQRDKKIQIWCKKNSIDCVSVEDYLLADIGTFLKDNEEPYKVFTPFKNYVLQKEKEIAKPKKYALENLFKTDKLLPIESGLLYRDIVHPQQLVRGGRKRGLSLLQKSTSRTEYDEKRNLLTYESTHLSAYIKFGCVSIREVFWKWKSVSPGLLGQLIWREFYYYIIYFYPEGLRGVPFQTKYKDMKWEKNTTYINAWKNGMTGYPVVDAGIRQMIATGYMSNRSRLITSNFLVRILGQDWRIGEKYFATMLTDYDPSVNNGNWQWVSSVGVDPKPHFQRLFNPWNQSKQYDEHAKYIKKWVPELREISSEHIHEWDKYALQYKTKYPSPIVNYKERRELSLAQYRNK